MEIDRATEKDYQAILDLQAKYYIQSLSPEERRDGFLSAEFSRSQIAAMADDLGIVVARVAGRLVGYVCASRVDLMPRPPILDVMMRGLQGVIFHGTHLSVVPMFIYGPVCIDTRARGRGILQALFLKLKAPLIGRFEVGVAFIAHDNPRSLAAHTRRLGMEIVGSFEHNGSRFHTVAFLVK